VLAQLENAESAETVAMWREILWEPYALAPLDFLPDDASITSYQVHKPGASEGMLAARHPLEAESYSFIQFDGYIHIPPDVADSIAAIESVEAFQYAWVDFVELEGELDGLPATEMSVNYEIVGDYTDIFAFVDALQQEYPRHVLIRDFRVEAQEFEPHRDPMSFTYRIKMDTDMYAMVKGGIPTDNDIDYDIPGLAPPVDSEGEKTDDAGGNADEADADSDLSTDE